MAYDEESLFMGISIGKAMKGWARAPAKGSGFGGGVIPLVNYVAPYYAIVIPAHELYQGVAYATAAVSIPRKKTTQATYTEVIP